MGIRQKLADADRRVNEQLGVGGVQEAARAVEVRRWWAGLVGFALLAVTLTVLDAVGSMPGEPLLLLAPSVLVFKSGFLHNEHVRATGGRGWFGLRPRA